jgi:hypothetical protein
LRHGYATLLLEQGIEVAVVSRMLHHARTSTTQDVYQHVTERLSDEAAAVLDGRLGALMARETRDFPRKGHTGRVARASVTTARNAGR